MVHVNGEGPKPGPKSAAFLERDVTLPPLDSLAEHCKLPRWGQGQIPGDLAI